MAGQNALPEGTWVDHYQIVRKLGQGGFGITYLATEFAQAEGGGNMGSPLREVAIKEYFPSSVASREDGRTVAPQPELKGAETAFQSGLKAFYREAQSLAQLDHEGIIKIYRVFERNGTAYFVMPFLQGETLAALLRRDGTLAEERARQLLMPVLNGLAYAHGKHILHRDIKPDNIMIRQNDGRSVLIDFGTARAEVAVDVEQYTRYSELIAFTPGYAAFEQYGHSTRQNAHGPQTDVYGLAAVLYQVATGDMPVESTTRVAETQDGQPDPLLPASAKLMDEPGYTRAFLTAIDWGMELAGRDRPQSMTDFRKALDGKLPLPEKVVHRLESHHVAPAALATDSQGELAARENERLKARLAELQADTNRLREERPTQIRLPAASRRSRWWLVIPGIVVAGAVGAFYWRSNRPAGLEASPAPSLEVRATPAEPPPASPAPSAKIDAQALQAASDRANEAISHASALVREQGGDADIVLQNARETLAGAEHELAGGDATVALAAFVRAEHAAGTAVRGFLDALAGRYRAIAQMKLKSGDPRMAELALAKARDVEKLNAGP